MTKAKKRKVGKKSKPRQELDKSDIPEELETVWDKDIAAAFLELNPQQQNFLLAYLKEWNGAEAYRQSYNKLATNEVAAACASRIVCFCSSVISTIPA